MKVYRMPIEVEEILKLAKGHEYGDTYITVVIPFNFRRFVDYSLVLNFEDEISEAISPNDSSLRSIEYKLIGIDDEDHVLLEVTADATTIIDEYRLEMEDKRSW